MFMTRPHLAQGCYYLAVYEIRVIAKIIVSVNELTSADKTYFSSWIKTNPRLCHGFADVMRASWLEQVLR
jgi:hypothetical protein